MNEKIEEYLALRNEITSIHELQRTIWIYMYTVFAALFVLGIEWSHYFFLVTYVIIIPFQSVINDYSWTISKIASYIRYFFEKEREDMHWETMHIQEIFC